MEVKKLVDSPLSEVNAVAITQIKDIFNALTERLNSWRTILSEDRSRLYGDPDKMAEGRISDRLVILLQALNMISSSQMPLERAQDFNVKTTYNSII